MELDYSVLSRERKPPQYIQVPKTEQSSRQTIHRAALWFLTVRIELTTCSTVVPASAYASWPWPDILDITIAMSPPEIIKRGIVATMTRVNFHPFANATANPAMNIKRNCKNLPTCHQKPRSLFCTYLKSQKPIHVKHCTYSSRRIGTLSRKFEQNKCAALPLSKSHSWQNLCNPPLFSTRPRFKITDMNVSAI